MSRASSTKRYRVKPGFALLLATITAALLASVAATIITQTRATAAASAQALRLQQAENRVRGLIAQAIVMLDAGEASNPSGLLFENVSGRVFRQDAAGLVDLNSSEPAQLTRLMELAGVNQNEAQALTNKIMDWRDEDDLERIDGAEAEKYAEKGMPAPANRDFVTETEISSVLGISPKLTHCLLPYVTVYSRSPNVDLISTPPLLREGQSETTESRAALAIGAVTVLTAITPLSAQANLRFREWVRLTGDPLNPFLVHRASEEFAAIDPPNPCASPDKGFAP